MIAVPVCKAFAVIGRVAAWFTVAMRCGSLRVNSNFLSFRRSGVDSSTRRLHPHRLRVGAPGGPEAHFVNCPFPGGSLPLLMLSFVSACTVSACSCQTVHLKYYTCTEKSCDFGV